jgi:hypothetical protein
MKGVATLGGIRPTASLSSGLLARKGQARPAMRPQTFASTGDLAAAAADDLGWNDMGAPDPVADPLPGPAPAADLPPVLVERSALMEEVARIAPAPVVAQAVKHAVPEAELGAMVARRPAGRGGKVAFTLRLPTDRHLRLRLAAAVTHRSAQAIVTDALDAFLATLPEVDALAGRCATADRPEERP